MGRTVSRVAAALLLATASVAFALSAAAQSPQVPIPRLAPRGTLGTDPSPGTVPATTAAAAAADQDGDDDSAGPTEPIGTGDDADTDVDNPDDINPPDTADPGDPAIDLSGPPANAPGDTTPPTSSTPTPFALSASLTPDGAPLAAGMTWRVFDSKPGADGKLKLVAEVHGGSAKLTLLPGIYFVHAAFGHAGVAKKILVGGPTNEEAVVLNAGGLRLTAAIGKDTPLAAGDVSFDIYTGDDNADGRQPVVTNAPPEHVIGLTAGTYHVVCRYGDANAVVRADIRVEPGKLTDATVFQKAARMTLKLVTEHGGEALADTAWSVVTPSGDNIADSVGAFPSMVLAAGDYTAIAKHDGKIYEHNFTVEAGLNHDVELIAN